MTTTRGGRAVPRQHMASPPQQRAVRHDSITAPEGTALERLGQEEARIGFDEQARNRLGISGDAFLEAWDSERPEGLDESDVMWVASLLPLVRPSPA